MSRGYLVIKSSPGTILARLGQLEYATIACFEAWNPAIGDAVNVLSSL
jgi:hypothetical protein